MCGVWCGRLALDVRLVVMCVAGGHVCGLVW